MQRIRRARDRAIAAVLFAMLAITGRLAGIPRRALESRDYLHHPRRWRRHADPR